MSKTGQLERKFKFNNQVLKDIDPTLSPEEIMQVYSNQYPELVNATIEGPELSNNSATWTFTKNLGKKG